MRIFNIIITTGRCKTMIEFKNKILELLSKKEFLKC